MANLNVQESAHIAYDNEILANSAVILRKKYTFIYVLICIGIIFAGIFSTLLVTLANATTTDIALVEKRMDELKPQAERLKALTSSANREKLAYNRFLLENLFYVDEKTYEMLARIKSFFEDPQVIASVWAFKISSVATAEGTPGGVQDLSDLPPIQKKLIKIEGKYSQFSELKSMMNVLTRMRPILVIERVSLGKDGSALFSGYTYVFNKKVFTYDYGSHYANVNKLLKQIEDYRADMQNFKAILSWENLNLESFSPGFQIYNCDQMEKIGKQRNLKSELTDKLIECRNYEKLVAKEKSDIDASFDKINSK